MIYSPRPSSPEDVLSALNKQFLRDKKTELERARAYYKKKRKKAYDFERYKEWDVCRALDKLFNEKCAYCETSYRAVDARDVEHFRPKGGVSECPKHPGYWWLAAEWTNLLPSCPPCNQKRRQLSYDQKMTLEEFEEARLKQPDSTSGKANSFPLLKNNWVTMEGDDIKIEEPLLINPCERQPYAHIEWVFDWDKNTALWKADPVTALLRPRLCADGSEDPYGKASIAIYGLNRAGLFRERMERVRQMQISLKSIVYAIGDRLRATAGSRAWIDLGDRLKELRHDFEVLYTKPDKPYAGMATAFLALFDAELLKLGQ